jgi:hypothetical protein
MLIEDARMTEGKRFCTRMYANVIAGTCGPTAPTKSAPSNTACKLMPVIDHGAPKPPTAITVTASAWEEKDMVFYTRLVRVKGVVLPIGAECGEKLDGRAGRRGFYYFGTDGLVAKCAEIVT